PGPDFRPAGSVRSLGGAREYAGCPKHSDLTYVDARFPPRYILDHCRLRRSDTVRSMAFDINGDLSYARLCVKQLARALRRPLTMEKAEGARFCLSVIQRDIEEWIR